jgi:excisionase family DNA binding protein
VSEVISESIEGGGSEDSRPGSALPVVLTVDEAAELLRVDRKTVYESIRRGELPGVVRLGRSIRIGRTALLEFLAGQGRVSRQGKTR